MGIAKDGSKKENFQRGVELRGSILFSSFCNFDGTFSLTVSWL